LPPRGRRTRGGFPVLPGAGAPRPAQAGRHDPRRRGARNSLQADRRQTPRADLRGDDRRRIPGRARWRARRAAGRGRSRGRRGRLRDRAGAEPQGHRRVLPRAPASRTGSDRGADGMWVRALQHLCRPRGTEGRFRVRQPPGMRRRAGVRSVADPVGSVARRADPDPDREAGAGDPARGRRAVTAAPSLAVDLGGIVLPTPVMVAAGCAGTGRELAGLIDLRRVGAIVSRTITVTERVGSDVPRIAESPAGIVWETGLQNPGLDAFVSGELPRLAPGGARIIVSIGGDTLEEYVRMTSALQGRPEVAAIEIHLSGRDDELDRAVLGAHADRLNEIVGAVARMSLVPVFAKL